MTTTTAFTPIPANQQLLPSYTNLTPPEPPSVSPSSPTNKSPHIQDKETKRRMNTLAARRYRQKRNDEVEALTSELKDTREERDELKLRVAKLEGEAELLRRLLAERAEKS